MKTIYRNLLSVIRRFKMATALNVLGLSVAFAAFMVIMKQINYDRTFDTADPNHNRIFRMEMTYGSGTQAIICRPLAEQFFNSSPHILAGTIVNPFSGSRFFRVVSGSVTHSFKERIIQVSPEFADVFTFDFVEGTQEVLKEPDKVMIPLSMAHKFFGNETAVGRQLMFKDESNVTVGAVYRDVPANSLVENVMYAAMPADENKQNWSNWNYYIYVRVDDAGVIDDVYDNFKRNFLPESVEGSTFSFDEKVDLRFTALPEIHYTTDVTYDNTPKASRQTLSVLLAIGIVMIVIAGINFTNFSTALTPVRIKSINTQKVLGSSPATIRRSLLMEAILISFSAYLLSLVMIRLFASSPLASLVNADLSLMTHPLIIGGTALIALLTGLSAGLYPAFYMTSFSPALVLKGSFGLSQRGRTLRSVLISIQFFASFALIIGALFMYMQNHYMQHTSLGYDKDALIVSNINNTVYKQLDAFTAQLKTNAVIDDVSYGKSLLSSADQYMGWGKGYKNKEIHYQCLPVEWSFLDVAGIEVVEGRNFRIEDAKTRHGAYIFNEKARAIYDLEVGTMIDSATIVGIMPDIKFASLRTEVLPMAFYVSGTEYKWMYPKYAYIKVKGGSDMRAAIEHVRNTLSTFDSDYPFDIRFFDEVLQRLYKKERALSALITLFSLLAVFISIVGVFGLVVFDSEYRKKEIGIRKVFGSTTQQILAMFNRTYMRIVLVCFVAAAPVAYYAVTKWLENFAYKTPLYWWVFALSFVAVAFVTFATVTFQNWRAANANPVKSLRSE